MGFGEILLRDLAFLCFFVGFKNWFWGCCGNATSLRGVLVIFVYLCVVFTVLDFGCIVSESA